MSYKRPSVVHASPRSYYACSKGRAQRVGLAVHHARVAAQGPQLAAGRGGVQRVHARAAGRRAQRQAAVRQRHALQRRRLRACARSTRMSLCLGPSLH